MTERIPLMTDGDTIRGLIQAEKVLRGIESHWPADSVASAIAELRHLREVMAQLDDEEESDD